MKKLAIAMIAALALMPFPSAIAFATHTTPQFDAHNFVPGQSFGPIELGMTRKQVHQLMITPPLAARHAERLLDDTWQLGPDQSYLDVIYRRGNVIQVEVGRDNLYPVTFAKLLQSRKWSLHLQIYDIPDEMGGFVKYYYDDRMKGLCFCAGAQDDFILDQFKPDSIIIHRPGNQVKHIE